MHSEWNMITIVNGFCLEMPRFCLKMSFNYNMNDFFPLTIIAHCLIEEMLIEQVENIMHGPIQSVNHPQLFS